jgi:phage terminase large subunit-like protein
MWDLSRRDWQERIRRGASLMPDLPGLHQANAARAVGIFDRLRLPDVPGRPAMAEAAGPWMREIVAALFGSWDGAERHIREAFIVVPKKNSKTTGGAAIMVTALLVNRRPRAEFLIVAPTQEVADLAFRQAVGMIESDPVLAALFHVQEHLKKITYRSTRAFLKVKSFDPKIVTGTKPAGVLLDELHVIAEAHDADRVIGQLRGGLVSQPEGFLITITTQSERAPSGVFLSELRKARAVRDGTLAAPILPILYEFPPGVAWEDPANWPMVTPNQGRSVSIERLIPDHEAARAAGDAELRRWASQHLNVEIGVALLADAWAGADYWETQADRSITLQTLIARSEVVTIGVDGGGLDDLLGLAVLGRERDSGRWLAWCRAWAHPVVLRRRQGEAARLRDFAADGDLRLVERIGDDMEALVGIVAQVRDARLLPEKHGIGIDPGNSHAVVDALTAAGFAQEQMAAVSQGWRLGGAIKLAERRLAEGTLLHGGQPLMAWCVGNAKVEPRGNALLITKQASGTAKIDPLMALFNAAELMARAPTAFRSFYDDPETMRIAFGCSVHPADDDEDRGWRRVW